MEIEPSDAYTSHARTNSFKCYKAYLLNDQMNRKAS